MFYPHISPTTLTGQSERFLSNPLHDLLVITWRAGSVSAIMLCMSTECVHCVVQTHALVTCESRQATVLPQSGMDEPDQFEPIERGSKYDASW